MKKMTKQILRQYDELFEERKQKVLNAKDELVISGTSYYVSNTGDDNNDGRSPETPWKTLKKVSETYLRSGDGVFFKRGDLFRGTVHTRPGVTYAAYGTGDKPKFYGCEKSLADPALWEEIDKENHIWKCTEKMLDAGTIVFNDGEAHARKLIPSYKNMQFVCRDDESRIFVMANEMTRDLDMYWHYETLLTKQLSRGEDFPVPEMYHGDILGDIYLRCDRGNQALRKQVAVAAVNISKLQNVLERENIMVHFPDEYLPDDKTVCIHGKNAVEIDGGHF